MINYINKAINLVKEDKDLMGKSLIKNLVQTFESKRVSDLEDYLGEFKQSLIEVNEAIKSDKIEDINKSIDSIVEGFKIDNPDYVISKMYNEFDIASEIRGLKESDSYKNPTVKGYVDSMEYQMRYTKYPNFLYLGNHINSLSPVAGHDKSVKESIDRVNSYIEDNRKRLILLETVNKLDAIPNEIYKTASKKIKESIVEGKLNSNTISIKLSESASIPMVKAALDQLRMMEKQENPELFDLGSGSGNVKVNNYVGPAIKEEKSLIVPIGNKYLKITEDDIKESLSLSDGDVKVIELSPEYIKENYPEFLDIVESFGKLGFYSSDNGITFKSKNSKIDFKINEDEELDLYVNGVKIEDVDNIDFNEMFFSESKANKDSISHVLNNIDSVYNIEFIKNITNENKYSSIININDDYLVYDFLANERKAYKLDGANLHKFILENYDYDVRWAFDVAISDKNKKYKEIEENKSIVFKEIEALEDSRRELEDTLKGYDIDESKKEKINDLIDKIDKSIVEYKSKYVVLENEGVELYNIEGGEIERSYDVGDTVTIEDEKQVKIVAKDGDNYMVMDQDGNPLQITSANIVSKSEGLGDEACSCEEETGDLAQKTEELPAGWGNQEVEMPIETGGAPASGVYTESKKKVKSELINEDHKDTPEEQRLFLKDVVAHINEKEGDQIKRAYEGLLHSKLLEFDPYNVSDEDIKTLYIQTEEFLADRDIVIEEIPVEAEGPVEENPEGEYGVTESSINEDHLEDPDDQKSYISGVLSLIETDDDLQKEFEQEFKQQLKSYRDDVDKKEDLRIEYERIEDFVKKNDVKLDESHTMTIGSQYWGPMPETKEGAKKKMQFINKLIKAVDKLSDKNRHDTHLKARFNSIHKSDVRRVKSKEQLSRGEIDDIYLKLQDFNQRYGVIKEAKEEFKPKSSEEFAKTSRYSTVGYSPVGDIESRKEAEAITDEKILSAYDSAKKKLIKDAKAAGDDIPEGRDLELRAKFEILRGITAKISDIETMGKEEDSDEYIEKIVADIKIDLKNIDKSHPLYVVFQEIIKNVQGYLNKYKQAKKLAKILDPLQAAGVYPINAILDDTYTEDMHKISTHHIIFKELGKGLVDKISVRRLGSGSRVTTVSELRDDIETIKDQNELLYNIISSKSDEELESILKDPMGYLTELSNKIKEKYGYVGEEIDERMSDIDDIVKYANEEVSDKEIKKKAQYIFEIIPKELDKLSKRGGDHSNIKKEYEEYLQIDDMDDIGRDPEEVLSTYSKIQDFLRSKNINIKGVTDDKSVISKLSVSGSVDESLDLESLYENNNILSKIKEFLSKVPGWVKSMLSKIANLLKKSSDKIDKVISEVDNYVIDLFDFKMIIDYINTDSTSGGDDEIKESLIKEEDEFDDEDSGFIDLQDILKAKGADISKKAKGEKEEAPEVRGAKGGEGKEKELTKAQQMKMDHIERTNEAFKDFYNKLMKNATKDKKENGDVVIKSTDKNGDGFKITLSRKLLSGGGKYKSYYTEVVFEWIGKKTQFSEILEKLFTNTNVVKILRGELSGLKKSAGQYKEKAIGTLTSIMDAYLEAGSKLDELLDDDSKTGSGVFYEQYEKLSNELNELERMKVQSDITLLGAIMDTKDKTNEKKDVILSVKNQNKKDYKNILALLRTIERDLEDTVRISNENAKEVNSATNDFMQGVELLIKAADVGTYVAGMKQTKEVQGAGRYSEGSEEDINKIKSYVKYMKKHNKDWAKEVENYEKEFGVNLEDVMFKSTVGEQEKTNESAINEGVLDKAKSFFVNLYNKTIKKLFSSFDNKEENYIDEVVDYYYEVIDSQSKIIEKIKELNVAIDSL